MCEKPMALNEADCERMIEACDKEKVKLSLDFQNRYHPAHVMARRLIRAGEVGEIRVAKAQICHGYMKGHWEGWRADPGMAGAAAIMGSGQHTLDLLRFLLGREVEEVRALCVPPGDLDDQNFVILSFEGGIYATSISGVMAPRSDNDAVLYGTKAKVTCKGTLGTMVQGEILIEGESINIRSSFPVDNPITGNYVRLIEAFNRSIVEDREPDIPAQNGLQMVRITNAILESSRQSRAIKLRN
jgi:predicted dehydrogenase